MNDFLIVGAGLFGSVFARLATDNGYSVTVIDKREHIGGNIYTKRENNIDIHMYGPHIFHTNSTEIWQYVNEFTKFNNYRHTPKVLFNDKIYSFPINLLTFSQVFNIHDPEKARDIIENTRIKSVNPEENLENYCLYHIGEELYKMFIYGYTKKQWCKDPKLLPASIIKRLPIRYTFDDNYYNAIYQGIPIDGYTKLITNLLDGINIELETDFFKQRSYYENKYKYIVYTGSIDKLFGYCHGELEWRSLRFENQWVDKNDYQGCSIINYTSEQIPFTRICEHKHFNYKQSDKTIITKEYSIKYVPGMEQYYPVNTSVNNNLYKQYSQMVPNNYIIGGRLGSYQYYDMDQVIGQALKKAKDFNT